MDDQNTTPPPQESTQSIGSADNVTQPPVVSQQPVQTHSQTEPTPITVDQTVMQPNEVTTDSNKPSQAPFQPGLQAVQSQPLSQQVPTTSPPANPSISPPGGPSSPQSPTITPIKQEKRISPIPLIALVLVIIVFGLGWMVYDKHHDEGTTKQTSNIKIGLMMAFSGGSSSMGYGTSKGVALAKKQLNANNITVVDADSQCDPKVAVTAINKLIKEHVVAIIGDGCSSASLAALPIANNAQIPMVSPSASSTELSIPNDYFFRVIPNDFYQGSFLAKTVYDRGLHSAAIFYTNEPYGTSIEQSFTSKFRSLGGKVVATTSAESDAIDLSAQINAIKAAKPQAVVFVPNSQVTGTAAVKLARQAGITVPFFGADNYYDSSITTGAPQASQGMIVTTFNTGTPAFKQALATAYPNDSQDYAAPEAYDAFRAIYSAIQNGATTGQEIKNMLPSIKFQGVSSYVSFNQYGDLASNNYNYALLEIKNGQFVQLN